MSPTGKPASHGGHPGGPVAAGGGEVGVGEEEEAPGEEAEEPEAEEEETGGEEAGEDEDDECTPPFVLHQEGARHELLLCREGAAGDEAFYLVLDGERIGNLELPYPE